MNDLSQSRLTLACSSLILLTAIAPLCADDVKETFANISEGALLTTLPQWTHASEDEDTWTLSNLGADGGAFEATSKGSNHRTLTDREVIVPSQEPRIFRFKIRFIGDDSWAAVQANLLEAGGINGCCIRFDGGESEGSGDNKIGISQGGAFWGDPKYKWIDARWQPNVWYQVEITNLLVTSQGATAKVTIFDLANPANKLVENQPLTSFGSAGTMQRLNIIAFSSTGAARPFQIGNIELLAMKAVPAP